MKVFHKKTGVEYRVINIANLKATKDDFHKTYVYERRGDGTVWALPEKQFWRRFKRK